ncbi:transglutaminase domain-containing protein [Hymenobacter sp. BT18]|uniref:transglutaminase-like domain-containing protein n=1 Tax=Hymenobacter sp. BT18 TaxID=2835648 RepID=UPI00143EC732|nr:transglutaminase-like domain-containing protein [Hymenobacter sp. BT18]QIX59704.1 transglutaminase domain-containing protein [Hymenobacter sp. BT18]
MVTLSEARALVPRPLGIMETAKADGITSDIIRSVLAVSESSAGQTAGLAAKLRGATALETCKNVFGFVRGNIRYQLDPAGQQLIKTPASVVHSGYCDCKGYALLINSLLRDLGIPSAFRFVSFGTSRTVTHVYAVAMLPAYSVVLDACLPRFNEEKAYTYKEDHMTKIIHISGVGLDHETPLALSGFESEGELDLKLARQTAELERNLAVRVQGIGSPLVNKLDEAVADYSRAINAIPHGAAHVAAIGYAIGKKGKKKAVKPGAAPANDRKKRRGNFITRAAKSVAKGAKKVAKKAGTVAKKAGKAVVKVATAPMRLLTKGLAEVMLPKLAPMFLYLFITNPTTIAALPARVQRKRKKAEKFARFMTKTVGMKEKHFMQIVRNGIMRKMGATPEQILSARVKGPISGIEGIGDISELLSIALEIVNKILSVFGKKPAADETPTADDMPDVNSDFSDATDKQLRQLAVHLTKKPASQKGQEPDTLRNEMLQEAAEEFANRQVEQEPDDTPVDATLPGEEAAYEESYAEESSSEDSYTDTTADMEFDPDSVGKPGRLRRGILKKMAPIHVRSGRLH